MNSCSRRRRAAFTRADLLAALASAVLLAALALTTAAAGRPTARAAVCRNNLKQLALAWQHYAGDNRGHLIGASAWTPPGSGGRTIPDWSGGNWLDNTPEHRTDPNNWDTELLAQGRPLRSVATYRCPADPSTAFDTRRQRVVPRIRSYSLNGWVGGPGWSESGPWWPQNPTGWRVHLRLDDFRELAPAQAFTFLDEREDSINDGYFAVDMRGHPTDGAVRKLVDFPADYHNRGANLAFADTHVESWRWRDARTTPPHQPGVLLRLNLASADNPDIRRLQDHATRQAQ